MAKTRVFISFDFSRSGRRVTMHLPKNLPWADSFRDAYLTAHALAVT